LTRPETRTSRSRSEPTKATSAPMATMEAADWAPNEPTFDVTMRWSPSRVSVIRDAALSVATRQEISVGTCVRKSSTSENWMPPFSSRRAATSNECGGA